MSHPTVDTHAERKSQVKPGAKSPESKSSEGSLSSVRKQTCGSNTVPVDHSSGSNRSSTVGSGTPCLQHGQQSGRVQQGLCSIDDDHSVLEFGSLNSIISKRPYRASRDSASLMACCTHGEGTHMRCSSGGMSLPPLRTWLGEGNSLEARPSLRKCNTIDTIRTIPADPVTTHTHTSSVAQRLRNKLPASDEGSHHVTFQVVRSGTSIYEVIWKENISQRADGTNQWSPGISPTTTPPTKDSLPRSNEGSTTQRHSFELVNTKLTDWSWSGDASGSLRRSGHSSEDRWERKRYLRGSASLSYDDTPAFPVPPNSLRQSRRSSARATSAETPETSSSVSGPRVLRSPYQSTLPDSHPRPALTPDGRRPMYQQHFTGHKDSLSLLREQARWSSTQLSYPPIFSTFINQFNPFTLHPKALESGPRRRAARQGGAGKALRRLLDRSQRESTRSGTPMASNAVNPRAKCAPSAVQRYVEVNTRSMGLGTERRCSSAGRSRRKGVHFRDLDP